MTPYPVVFDVTPPHRFERVQLLLRLLIMVVLGMIGISGGWIFLLLYLALPVIAAIVVDTQGPAQYLERTAPAVTEVLRWLLSFAAYMAFLSDRFPAGEATLVRLMVPPTGMPTRRTALLRLVTSIPEAVVLLILGFVSGIVWFLSALCVLFSERVPLAFLGFQRGLIRWQARLFAYHASLVDVQPPYALEGGPEIQPGR